MNTKPSPPRADDSLSRVLGEEDARAYRRFIDWSVGQGFKLAIVETRAPVEVKEIVEWTTAQLADVCVIALDALGTKSLGSGLEELCTVQPSLLLLTRLEESPHRIRLCRELNVTRDELVKRWPVPWVVVAHSSAVLDLEHEAPDFVDFAGLWLGGAGHHRIELREELPFAQALAPGMSTRTPMTVGRTGDDAAGLLARAREALIGCRYDEAADLLAQFDIGGKEASEHLRSERALVEAVLHNARGNHRRATDLFDKLIQDANTPENIRANALLERGTIAFRQGGASDANRLLRKAEAIYGRLGDVHGRAIVIGERARIRRVQGKSDEAQLLFREQARLFEEAGDQRSRAVAQGSIAYLLSHQGDVEGALQSYMEQVRVFEEAGDRYSKAVTLGYIAQLRFSKGEVDEAKRLLDEALHIFEEMGVPRERAITLGEIARIREHTGDLDEALRLFLEQARQFEELGEPRERAITLGYVARIRYDQGYTDEALRLTEEALRIFKQLDDPRSRAVTLGDIGRIRLAKGEVDVAFQIQKERLHIFEELDDVDGRANALWCLGRIKASQGHVEEALLHLQKSYELLLPTGRIDGIGFVALYLGRLLCVAGRRDEGLAILEHARESFLRMSKTSEADMVVALMAKVKSGVDIQAI